MKLFRLPYMYTYACCIARNRVLGVCHAVFEKLGKARAPSVLIYGLEYIYILPLLFFSAVFSFLTGVYVFVQDLCVFVICVLNSKSMYVL